MPAVQLLSLEQLPGGPPPLLPPLEQSPGGAGVEHAASLVRWLTGTRPPSTPLEDPPLELPLLLVPPLLEPLLLDPPLLEPLLLDPPLLDPLLLDPPLLPPELEAPLLEPLLDPLDELPPSPPPEGDAVTPPQAQSAASTTTAPSARRMSPTSGPRCKQLGCRPAKPALSRGARAGVSRERRGDHALAPTSTPTSTPTPTNDPDPDLDLDPHPHQYEIFRMNTSDAGARLAAPRSSVACSPGPRDTAGTCERVYTR